MAEKQTILNVDDNEPSRYTTTHILLQGGYEVLEAATGAQALSLARKQPDLILLDVNLPDIGGFEVCRRLKADSATASIPVLHLSATYNDAESRVRGLEGGADGYLTHPIEPPVLVSTIKSLLRLRQSEKELRASEERFHHILHTAADAIVAVDQNGRICLVNSQATAAFGYTEAELLGKPVETLVPDRFRGKHAAYVHEYLAAPRMRSMGGGLELLARRKDGSEFPCEISLSPLHLRNGMLVTAMVRDISERKKHDQLLQDIAQAVSGYTGTNFFRSLTEYVAGAIEADHCFIGQLVEDGKAVRTMALYSGGRMLEGITYQLAGTPCADVVRDQRLCVFPSGATQRFPKDQLLAEMNAEAYLGVPLLAKDGTLQGLMTALFTKPLTNPNRALAMLRIFAARAGAELERSAYEASLRAAEAEYRGIFENAVEGICHTTIAGRFLKANRAMVHMLGYESEEELVAGIDDLAQQVYVDPAVRRSMLERLQKEGVVRGLEAQWVRKDGAKIHVSLSVRIVADPQKNSRYLESFVQDITQQRVTEEQLRQSQKMEAIGQLAGGVAHDFNNLLTVINGYADIVRAALPATDPHTALLSEVVRAGNRAAELTSQLLAFSRKQMLAPKVLDLNDVIEKCEKMLRRMIGEDVLLVTVYGRSLPRVLVDPGQIEQVVMNLAVNARDATPQGGTLTITTGRRDLNEERGPPYPDCKPGSYVTLAMTDTGCGMTPEVQARIFEPFYTTKEVGKGTGLGLATVYGIVKQSGGYIAVDSTVGVGTTFTMLLPAVLQTPAPAKADDPAAPVRRGNETILLVEDENGVRRLAQRILETHGYTVLAASGGREAMAIEQSHPGPIHLLITDVVMPGMSGRELAAEILARHPGLKVLYVSGYTDDAIVRHGVVAQTDVFLQKPFSLPSLAKKVRELLDRGN